MTARVEGCIVGRTGARREGAGVRERRVPDGKVRNAAILPELKQRLYSILKGHQK